MVVCHGSGIGCKTDTAACERQCKDSLSFTKGQESHCLGPFGGKKEC